MHSMRADPSFASVTEHSVERFCLCDCVEPGQKANATPRWGDGSRSAPCQVCEIPVLGSSGVRIAALCDSNDAMDMIGCMRERKTRLTAKGYVGTPWCTRWAAAMASAITWQRGR